MPNPLLSMTSFFRLIRANIAAAAWAITEGWYTDAALAALSVPVVELGPFLRVPDIFIAGVGADNDSVDWRFYLAFRTEDRPLGPAETAATTVRTPRTELKLLGSGRAVLSTLVGPASGAVVDSTERVADAMGTVTLTAWGTKILSRYNAAFDTVDPADNTRASLGLSDACGATGFAIDFQRVSGAPTSVNAFYRLSK